MADIEATPQTHCKMLPSSFQASCIWRRVYVGVGLDSHHQRILFIHIGPPNMNRAPRVKVGQSLGHFLPILPSLISAFPYTLQISADQHHHQAHRDKNIRGQNYLDGNDREAGTLGASFS